MIEVRGKNNANFGHIYQAIRSVYSYMVLHEIHYADDYLLHEQRTKECVYLAKSDDL